MNQEHFEIERKYLIARPDEAWLRRNAQPSQIRQTYLCSRPNQTARVRQRGHEGAWVYTHTVKERLNALRRIENEREVSEEEYLELLKQADPERRIIEKTRWVLPYQGQMFEIDVFPFWHDRAIMEIELQDEDQPVELPPEIRIFREVTDDSRYTNAAMSVEIPNEQL